MYKLFRIYVLLETEDSYESEELLMVLKTPVDQESLQLALETDIYPSYKIEINSVIEVNIPGYKITVEKDRD